MCIYELQKLHRIKLRKEETRVAEILHYQLYIFSGLREQNESLVGPC